MMSSAWPELKPRSRAADDRRRRIEIVETDQRRPLDLLDVDHRTDRRHGSVARPDLEVLDFIDARAVVGQRLRVDLEHVSELVELGRVGRSDVARQGGKDVADRDAERLGLDAVDDDVELGGAGPEGRAQPLQSRLGAAVPDHGVGQALQQRVVEIAVLDLDLHAEAADVADALDRGRQERERDRLRHALQGAIQILVDRAQILSLLLEAHVPVIEDHKGDARVGECLPCCRVWKRR